MNLIKRYARIYRKLAGQLKYASIDEQEQIKRELTRINRIINLLMEV